ncbi:MAG: peptide-methionine (S)-S-oxide reductase [Marinilabiliales bacterium]|nr:peptide-methionine (S)-S-oxide reductase [Marinilabiliales bacterium]
MREVCTGETGHAEVIQDYYLIPEIISLLNCSKFSGKHSDPTTLNRQGADVGTQYRSVIFYHNQSQKELAMVTRRNLMKLKSIQNQ